MPVLERQALCINHPPERAVAACDNCHRAFCEACLVEGLAVPEVYCSEACRAAAEPGSVERYMAGFRNPFGTGLKLWAQALPSLLRHMLPLAAVATALLWWYLPAIAPSQDASAAAPFALFGLVVLGAYSILLTGTILTQHYTGLIRGNAYTWALRSLVPWVLTWIIVGVAVSLGYMALIIPGFIAVLRLFWADEFVVAHRLGPVDAVKRSWELTKGQLGEVFIFQFLAGAFGWVIFMAGLFGLIALGAIEPMIGLVGAPLLYLTGSLIFLVGYGILHAPELAKFYGMRVNQLQKQLAVSDKEESEPTADSR